MIRRRKNTSTFWSEYCFDDVKIQNDTLQQNLIQDNIDFNIVNNNEKYITKMHIDITKINNDDNITNNDDNITNNDVNIDCVQVIPKDSISYDHINTLVFSSSEMYVLSILGRIDRMQIENRLNLNNITNYISSSFGTIVIVYLAFGYSPKEILQIFNQNLTWINDNIFSILENFGIFEITHFVDELLKPLNIKLGLMDDTPEKNSNISNKLTLEYIHDNTGKNCIFIGYNFSKNKTIIYSRKTHSEIPINDLIVKCCILPFIFKKHKSSKPSNVLENNNEKILNEYLRTNINEDDLYIDYSLIDTQEYEHATMLVDKIKILFFKVNTIHQEKNIDVKNNNIIEMIKQIFEIIQQKINTMEYHQIDNRNIINIEVNSYNKILLFDKCQKHKELINLFCNGFNINTNYIENNTIKQLTEINIKNKEYTGIVISGGGTNVYLLLGGIKYCLENNIIDLNKIETYIATSAGSILCIVLALNFTFEQLIDVYLENSERLKLNMNELCITTIIKQKSIYSNKILINSYESFFIKYRNGQIPTLLDIKINYNKELVFTVFNLTKNKIEYLNYKNSPDLLVTIACAMTSCLPIIFNPIEYNNCFYIDGGIKINYPVEKTHEYLNQKFIGYHLHYINNFIKMNLLDFLYYFSFENCRKYKKQQIKISKNCKSYNFDIIVDENRDTQSFLTVTKNTIKKLMDTGHDIMKQHSKNSNNKST
jgi:NTE family protein